MAAPATIDFFLVLFFYRGISSTPELLEPVLRPRTALYCGDEFMREQQQKTLGNVDEKMSSEN